MPAQIRADRIRFWRASPSIFTMCL